MQVIEDKNFLKCIKRLFPDVPRSFFKLGNDGEYPAPIQDHWIVWQESKKNAVHDGFILLPLEPSEAIKTALSYQCFDFIKVAEIYRKHGFDIPKKAEAEQAFFLHKFLILAIKHGNDFVKVFNEETKKMIEENEK